MKREQEEQKLKERSKKFRENGGNQKVEVTHKWDMASYLNKKLWDMALRP